MRPATSVTTIIHMRSKVLAILFTTYVVHIQRGLQVMVALVDSKRRQTRDPGSLLSVLAVIPRVL